MGYEAGLMVISKSVAKRTLDALMRIAGFPFYFIYTIETRIVGERKAFGALMQLVSLFPGVSGEWLRRSILQWVTSCPLKDCCICFGVLFSDHRTIIGDGVYIGTGCNIGYAEIGKNCVIGSSVHILSGLNQHMFHDMGIPIRDQGGSFTRVIIGEDCWIGNGAVLAASVGRGCVIGAGSVVVHEIEDFSVAVGNPARVIRTRQ
ncbi:MAG: acyltransferase [Pseudomonadota bacterium]